MDDHIDALVRAAEQSGATEALCKVDEMIMWNPEISVREIRKKIIIMMSDMLKGSDNG